LPFFDCYSLRCLPKGDGTVILLYKLLEENREQIIASLLTNIPREVRAYSRIPRAELRESIEQLYDAYLDLVVSGDNTQLKHLFKYISRIRSAQSFSLSTILRALLNFSPVIRLFLQEQMRNSSGDGKVTFNRAMAKVERTTFESVATFTEVFQDYVQSRIDEHNEYLHVQNKELGIDLSKLIIFRA
jgi:hypothetical protein